MNNEVSLCIVGNIKVKHLMCIQVFKSVRQKKHSKVVLVWFEFKSWNDDSNR